MVIGSFQNSAAQHEAQAELYLAEGLYDEAVDLFRAGVELAPRDLDAHFYLGKAYLQRGLMADAEEQFEYVARSNPESQRAYVELVRIYTLQNDIPRAYNAMRLLLSLGFQDTDRILNDQDFEALVSYAPARELLDAAS